MSRILPLLSLLLLTATNSAQTEPEKDERWFQAEVIIFEIREKNTAVFQEIWPDDPGLPNYENVVELNSAVETTISNQQKLLEEGSNVTQARLKSVEQPFQLLPDEALTLTYITEKLDSSAKYVPILHIAWRQPVVAKREAQTIYIHSNLALAGEDKIAEDAALAAPLNTLDGTIKLYLGRYLHLEADLLYRNQTEPMNSNTFFMNLSDEEQPQTLFRLHQTRRMRSKELHYFDHPMFGLLTQITPYELPETETELSPLESENSDTTMNTNASPVNDSAVRE